MSKKFRYLLVILASLVLCGCGSASVASPATSAHRAVVPFRIAVVYCGKFDSAQVNQYGDTSGMIFRYTNVSQGLIGYPNLTVNFADGSQVTDTNVSGYLPKIGPGQSAYGDVAAVGDSGQSVAFRSCQMVSYTVGDSDATYTP
jgi:hypothetical protein